MIKELEIMLGIVSIIICIAMIWLVLVMIKPSKFFFFVKPETKWKRLKAIGIYFVLILALGMVTLLSTLDDTVATADVSKTKIEDSIPEKTVNKRVVEEAPKVKSKPQKDMLDPEKTYKLSDDECLDFRNSHGYDVWNNKGIGIYSWDYGITDSWFNKNHILLLLYII